MKKNPDTNNLLVAFALSMLIFMSWQYFIETPRQQKEALVRKLNQKQDLQVKKEQENTPNKTIKTRSELLAESPRLPIKSDYLDGSLNLKGLRLDNVSLVKYRQNLNKDAPEVVIFSPAGDKEGYFAEFGFLSQDTALKLPNADTVWTADTQSIIPGKPVNLSWNNGDGIVFNIEISLDEKYMFSVAASAKNAKGEPVDLQTYAYLNRIYDAKSSSLHSIVHEGPIGVFDGILKEVAYSKFSDEKSKDHPFEAKSGWLGITDIYWLAAIIPQGEFAAKFSNYNSGGKEHFHAEYIDNNQGENKLRLFVGAKEMAILDAYSAKYNIPLFDHAVDLGMFDFLTKPILKMLTYFYELTGNFGIAILILTVIVKASMYPLANKSYRSMEQVKKLTPKMNDIRERYKDDKLKMNQEIMELYKREKVNPASGCLPMVLQIPVFFALYKVLSVALEMRHAPFFGWIHDLSAMDSTNIFTAFGLLNWNTPSFLHLGIFPIIMCVTMIIQQRQSPPPPDPTQAQIMKYMPFMMLFLFSSFAVGLLIYWSWSNVLSILQQWHIQRKYKQHTGK